jgi:hypothetical protein
LTNRPVDRPLWTSCQNRQVQGERTHPDFGLLTTGFNRSIADLSRLVRNWLCMIFHLTLYILSNSKTQLYGETIAMI